MKKIFYLASIAALAFSSCAKDETTEAQINSVNGGSKITAAVVADDTRTHLEKVNGNYEIRWSAGDQLGVYAVDGLLKNAAFTLANDSDGKAVGVFTSQNEVLDPTKEYLAVYPRHQVALFDAVDKADYKNLNGSRPATVKHIDYSDVFVNIPEIQYYRNGSFYTGTVPSVSTNFVVSENGSQLSMQPVVDYLMVNIMSTEPISTLTLRLYDRTINPNTAIKIAGKGALSSYNVKGEKVYRHYMSADQTNMTDAITLEVNENAANVKCHDYNTYVFAVPGGILGTNNNIEAYIWVNDDTNTAKAEADFVAMDPTVTSSAFPAGSSFRASNAQLNYYIDNKGTASTSDDTMHSRYQLNANGTTYTDANGDPVIISKMENQVFWVNPLKDTNFDYLPDTRGSFIYNPYEDIIIDNQWELLEYIVNYDPSTGKDAFLCEDGAFDFSKKTMEDLATEMQDWVDYGKYQDLIDDYLADGFPCIENYSHNFVGNGAVISNIFKPLVSDNGIFGEVSSTGSVTGVTFANIEAASRVDEIDGEEVTFYGNVLAGKFEGTIKDVVIENVHGYAAVGSANVAAFNGIQFKNVSKLEHIFDNLVADNNLDLTKTWASVEGVTGQVFNKITPAENVADNDNSYDLNVITIAEGNSATYATLTDGVDIDKDNNAVAVVIGGVSYWTGDDFAATKAAASSGTLASYKKIEYAEQLAAGTTYGYLVSNMDMNWDNLKVVEDGVLDITESIAWKNDATYNVLLGNGTSTIKNIQMIEKGKGTTQSVAPFTVSYAYNVALENVGIDIITNLDTETVPAHIAGFSASAAEIDGVTIKNLKINAYRHDGTQNTQANYGSHYTFVGWLVANANDIKVTNSTVTGVESNVKGLSALVGRIAITNSKTSSHIKNSSASSVEFTMAKADKPAAIAKFAKFVNGQKYNVNGTAVAMVYNGTNSNSTIKFAGVGQPKFLFANSNADKGLNVVYVGDTVYDTLHNNDEF